MTFCNGDCYIGELRDFNMHGKGKIYYSNGDYYYGCFLNNKKNGHGNYVSNNGSMYTGKYYNDDYLSNTSANSSDDSIDLKLPQPGSKTTLTLKPSESCLRGIDSSFLSRDINL
jgi:hypothetical protein